MKAHWSFFFGGAFGFHLFAVHEGTLVHCASMASAWSYRLSSSVPDELLTAIKVGLACHCRSSLDITYSKGFEEVIVETTGIVELFAEKTILRRDFFQNPHFWFKVVIRTWTIT